jgi:hypothetical protein
VVEGAAKEGGDPTIDNQYGWNNTNLKTQNGNSNNFTFLIQSNFGTPNKPKTSSLKTLGLKAGQTVNVVEVFYNYQSVFFVGKTYLKTPATMYSMAIF